MSGFTWVDRVKEADDLMAMVEPGVVLDGLS